MKTEMHKQELMARYAAAKLTKYMKTMGGEHEAMIATKFAVEYEEDDFKRNARQQSETVAIELLTMDVEDAETAAAQA